MIAILVTTTDALERFVRSAVPGQACQYHRGLLIRDREVSADVNVHRLAIFAAALNAQGLLELVQERVREDCYRYLAIRTAVPAAALAA
jgi:hypothetical protein